jgi:hypothetical protein
LSLAKSSSLAPKSARKSIVPLRYPISLPLINHSPSILYSVSSEKIPFQWNHPKRSKSIWTRQVVFCISAGLRISHFLLLRWYGDIAICICAVCLYTLFILEEAREWLVRDGFTESSCYIIEFCLWCVWKDAWGYMGSAVIAGVMLWLVARSCCNLEIFHIVNVLFPRLRFQDSSAMCTCSWYICQDSSFSFVYG